MSCRLEILENIFSLVFTQFEDIHHNALSDSDEDEDDVLCKRLESSLELNKGKNVSTCFITVIILLLYKCCMV